MNYKELDKIKDEIKAELVAAGYDEGDAEICALAAATCKIINNLSQDEREQALSNVLDKAQEYINKCNSDSEHAAEVASLIADAYCAAALALATGGAK